MINSQHHSRSLSEANELKQDTFVTNGLNYDATVRDLELIGEAAMHIPFKVRNAHQEIPWRQLIGIRNRLIHGYLGIDHDILWSIIKDDLPVLLPELWKLKDQVS